MKRARFELTALALLVLGLAACQQPGYPGPMQRTGAEIDRAVVGAQRGVADFSQRAGQGLDQAGRAVGSTARQVGTSLHDRLAPGDEGTP